MHLRHSQMLNNIVSDLAEDMPIQFIPPKCEMNKFNNLINETDYKVICTGIGAKAIEYAKELENSDCNFINLVNQTSIIELANILKDALL